MHNNAEFLSRLSSNAYEFKEKCCYLRKKIMNLTLTEHSSHKNLGSSKRLFQENEIV